MANHFRFKQVSINKSKSSEKVPMQDKIDNDETQTEIQFEFDSRKLRLEVTLPTQFIIPVLSLAKKLAIPILAGSYLTLLSPSSLHNPVPLSPPLVQVSPQTK